MVGTALLIRLGQKSRGMWRRLRMGPVRGTQRRQHIADSVTANYLVCLETGTRHVLLRRHLRETLGLTPAQYRRRWGLPDDYPMVAANYARLRGEARRLQRCG